MIQHGSIRRCLDRLAEGRFRLRCLARPQQQPDEVTLHIRPLRVQFRRAPRDRYSFLQPALAFQQVAQMQVAPQSLRRGLA